MSIPPRQDTPPLTPSCGEVIVSYARLIEALLLLKQAPDTARDYIVRSSGRQFRQDRENSSLTAVLRYDGIHIERFLDR